MANFFQNTCKPQGLGGKIMVNMMNSGHAKMAEWGFEFLKLKETHTVLDIGCGGGANIAYMLKKCTKGMVKGIDYSEVSVEKSFAQVYKVLKVGGTFLICNESCGKNQADEKWTKMIEGMVIYTAEQIKEYLEKADFTDIKLYQNGKGWLCVIAMKAEG